MIDLLEHGIESGKSKVVISDIPRVLKKVKERSVALEARSSYYGRHYNPVNNVLYIAPLDSSNRPESSNRVNKINLDTLEVGVVQDSNLAKGVAQGGNIEVPIAVGGLVSVTTYHDFLIEVDKYFLRLRTLDGEIVKSISRVGSRELHRSLVTVDPYDGDLLFSSGRYDYSETASQLFVIKKDGEVDYMDKSIIPDLPQSAYGVFFKLEEGFLLVSYVSLLFYDKDFNLIKQIKKPDSVSNLPIMLGRKTLVSNYKPSNISFTVYSEVDVNSEGVKSSVTYKDVVSPYLSRFLLAVSVKGIDYITDTTTEVYSKGDIYWNITQQPTNKTRSVIVHTELKDDGSINVIEVENTSNGVKIIDYIYN